MSRWPWRVLAAALCLSCENFDRLRDCARLDDGGVVSSQRCAGGGAGGAAAGGAEAGGAGGGAGSWDGVFESFTAAWAWRASLPASGEVASQGLLARVDGSAELVHLARRRENATGAVYTTRALLDLIDGGYRAVQLDGLLDAVSLSLNRGVLTVVERNRLVAAERRARYFSQSDLTEQFPPGDGGEVVAAAWIRATSGSLGGLEVRNVPGGPAQVVHGSGTVDLPCPVVDGRLATLEGRTAADPDLLVVVGACDGGLRLLATTASGLVTQSAMFDAGTFLEVAPGRRSVVTVVTTYAPGNASAEVAVTRYEPAGLTVVQSRRFRVEPAAQLTGLSVDTLDRPLVASRGVPQVSVLDLQSGADASVTTSSSVSLLQLDAELNPLRLVGVGFPEWLNTRGGVVSGPYWVLDAACTFGVDGGTACPIDTSSFAMRLVRADGGDP